MLPVEARLRLRHRHGDPCQEHEGQQRDGEQRARRHGDSRRVCGQKQKRCQRCCRKRSEVTASCLMLLLPVLTAAPQPHQRAADQRKKSKNRTHGLFQEHPDTYRVSSGGGASGDGGGGANGNDVTVLSPQIRTLTWFEDRTKRLIHLSQTQTLTLLPVPDCFGWFKGRSQWRFPVQSGFFTRLWFC